MPQLGCAQLGSLSLWMLTGLIWSFTLGGSILMGLLVFSQQLEIAAKPGHHGDVLHLAVSRQDKIKESKLMTTW